MSGLKVLPGDKPTPFAAMRTIEEPDEAQQLARDTQKFLRFCERQRRLDAGEPLLAVST